MSGWQTIESDPGVFTQLVKDLGVQGVQFEDISYLEQLVSLSSPLYGVVFLFPYESSRYTSDSPIQGEFVKEIPKTLFFAKQTIQNACGTQAVLNTLLSIAQKHDSQIRLGTELDGFLQFTSDFANSALRGEAMSNSELIRTVHNSFTSPEPFESDQATPYSSGSNSELYHFVGFIPLEGHIYELDGLHQYPIVHKSYGTNNNDPQEFAKNILKLLQARIELMDISSQGRFSVMAIVHDKVEHFTKQLEASMDDAGSSYELQELLENELSQRDRWGREIALRRQNLYGLVCELSKQVIAKMPDNEFNDRLLEAGEASSQRRTQGYK